MSPAENLLYTTVKIETAKSGKSTGSGTGFFYSINLGDNRHSVLLVTNKHVLRDSDNAVIPYHVDGKPGDVARRGHTYNFDDIILHPNNDIDLCAINVSQILSADITAGSPLKLTSVSSTDIPTQEEWDYLDAIEEVTMIGCPNGIYDEVNNFPIVRQGVTSSNPSRLYNGKPEFLIDIACFPGSSGSPVFLFNRTGYLDRKTNSFLVGASRIKLLGVLYAGPIINNSGQIVLGTPGVQVATMMHLGNAIRSTEVLALEKVVRDAFAAEAAAG
jgi:Trypsin-like peptidase domain